MKLEDLLALQKSERHVAMRGSKRSRKRGESRRSYQSLRNPIRRPNDVACFAAADSSVTVVARGKGLGTCL